MAIVQATVPVANLATKVGRPNVLDVEYSTSVLLPVPGPMLVFWLRRSFVRAVMAVNEFLVFTEVAREYKDSGRSLNLDTRERRFQPSGRIPRSRFDRTLGIAALHALADRSRTVAARTGAASLRVQRAVEPDVDTEQTLLLERLSTPNVVFRDALDAGLIENTNRLFSDDFDGAKTFRKRTKMVLRALVATRKESVPNQITATLRAIADDALVIAERYPTFLAEGFAGLPQKTKNLLIQWMVAYHLTSTPQIAVDQEDLKIFLGFIPFFWSREWAFRRQERLEMAFGTPDLRGPVAADALPPEGELMREDYRALQQELTALAAERRESTTREQTALSIGSMQRRLNTVYYAGPGDVNQLTSQAMTSVLNEQIRNNVLAILREVSEARENVRIDLTRQDTSTTVRQTSKGVDPKMSATHHRFKVVVPVENTVYLEDVGLTWCPRITNPFLPLRNAARDAWDQAYASYTAQYYVPEPVRPHTVWERVDIKINVKMEGEESVSETFSYTLAATDRDERPDFDNASVVWEQNESFWNDDPDYWVIWLSDLRFSGGVISGEVTAETGDGGADFEGTAKIVIPVLRYSQETVNNLAQFEAELSDYNLKLQALQAQARQYANIKQREFIDYHASRDAITKTLVEALVKRSCTWTLASNLSYYKEIISRCVDWESARIEFESAPIDALYYSEYPPDHFMNSRAVRFFLPIFLNAEDVLFDVLDQCGSFFMRASVQAARDRITRFRTDIDNNGPQEILEFSASLTIGEHVEAVMSNHDLAQ